MKAWTIPSVSCNAMSNTYSMTVSMSTSIRASVLLVGRKFIYLFDQC